MGDRCRGGGGAKGTKALPVRRGLSATGHFLAKKQGRGGALASEFRGRTKDGFVRPPGHRTIRRVCGPQRDPPPFGSTSSAAGRARGGGRCACNSEERRGPSERGIPRAPPPTNRCHTCRRAMPRPGHRLIERVGGGGEISQGCIGKGGGVLKGRGGGGVWLGPPLLPGSPYGPHRRRAEIFEASIPWAPKVPKQNFGCQPQTLEAEEGGQRGGVPPPPLLRCTAVPIHRCAHNPHRSHPQHPKRQ